MPIVSNKKKTYQKKKTYTEGEVRRMIRQVSDDAVAKILLLCLVAARDEFDLGADETVKFMQTMERYVEYEKLGIVNMKNASESLKNETGIDLWLRT